MDSVSKYVCFGSNNKLRITSIELWNVTTEIVRKHLNTARFRQLAKSIRDFQVKNHSSFNSGL